MAVVWLVWTAACLLISVQQSDCENVTCYSRFSSRTGECGDLLGVVSEDECCMNLEYGFKRSDGLCKSCGYAEWSSWSRWSACSVSCKEGVATRQRQCYGVGTCVDDKQEGSRQMKPCEKKSCCPEMGGWDAWGPWQPCSVTCEPGTRKRERTCSNPKPKCDGTCDGSPVGTESCTMAPKCPTHGGWSVWGPWGDCSNRCAVEGGVLPVRQHLRTCTNPPPSDNPPGNRCPGSDIGHEPCANLPFCPVDGVWGPWQSASACSVTCGVGRQREQRECNDPAPKHGGRPCEGEAVQTAICIKGFCPVNGQWAEWSAWSECRSKKDKNNCPRGSEIQKRRRFCQHTANGGKACEGSLSNTVACMDFTGCKVPGSLSEWSEWGLCKPLCGQPKTKRVRTCEADLTKYGRPAQEANIVGTPIIDCSNSEGVREEEKPCLNPPPCPLVL